MVFFFHFLIIAQIKAKSSPTTPTPVPRSADNSPSVSSPSVLILQQSIAPTNSPPPANSPPSVHPPDGVKTSPSLLTLEEKYEIGKELGKGAFSSVYRAKNKFTDEEVAIKVVKKRDVEKRDLELLEREIKILKKLKHPNIVRLFDLFDSPESIYIVLELVPEGELFDHLITNGVYTESDARSIVRQVLEGVDYMHKNGVVHRDLKPENLLCKDATHIKIADFGMSKDISSMGMLKTAVGTPSYIAPEIIQGVNSTAYDSGCDIWSIGVLCYVILSGYTPFWGETQDELFCRITAAIFEFPSPEWDEISQQAKDFVTSLLTPNPSDRPSAEAALNHEWIKVISLFIILSSREERV
jgi:calcium/calmodulin-dependent protein kinase I